MVVVFRQVNDQSARSIDSDLLHQSDQRCHSSNGERGIYQMQSRSGASTVATDRGYDQHRDPSESLEEPVGAQRRYLDDRAESTSDAIPISDDTSSFFNECIALAHAMIDVILHGTTTSSLVTGKDQSAVFANQCRDAARLCTNLYSTYQTCSYRSVVRFKCTPISSFSLGIERRRSAVQRDPPSSEIAG